MRVVATPLQALNSMQVLYLTRPMSKAGEAASGPLQVIYNQLIWHPEQSVSWQPAQAATCSARIMAWCQLLNHSDCSTTAGAHAYVWSCTGDVHSAQ